MRLFTRLTTLCPISIIAIGFYICILFVFKFLIYRDWYQWCNRLQNKYLHSPQLDDHKSCYDRKMDRGYHQRIIAISLFGPKENLLFQPRSSNSFLRDLIQDVSAVYPGWILRVYHDNTIDMKQVREFQCRYDHVDFFNMTGKSYPLPRMWRFLPIGDEMVDIMLIRDLDSPLTHRERVAVDDWILSNKIMHIMRDHPLHIHFILAGMWDFRPANDRIVSQIIFEKIHNATLVKDYVGRGDQPFLHKEVWPLVKNNSLIHDSFNCQLFQDNSQPFPTKRPSVQGHDIFVGCVRPCSGIQYVFGECPMECRPKNHKDWIYC